MRILCITNPDVDSHLTRDIKYLDEKYLPTYSDTNNTGFTFIQKNIPKIPLGKISGKIPADLCNNIETFDGTVRVLYSSGSVGSSAKYITSMNNAPVSVSSVNTGMKFSSVKVNYGSSGTYTSDSASINVSGSSTTNFYVSKGTNTINFSSGARVRLVGMVVGEIYDFVLESGSSSNVLYIANSPLNRMSLIGKAGSENMLRLNRGSLRVTCCNSDGAIAIVSYIKEFN